MDPDHSSQVIQFCEYSMSSKNPKTVFTAAVVLFNHVLTYKRDFKAINQYLFTAIQTIMETIPTVYDPESLNAILLSEIRIIYKNAEICGKVMEMKDKFVKVHKEVRAKSGDLNVK